MLQNDLITEARLFVSALSCLQCALEVSDLFPLSVHDGTAQFPQLNSLGGRGARAASALTSLSVLSAPVPCHAVTKSCGHPPSLFLIMVAGV